jgi:hypothetical protein
MNNSYIERSMNDVVEGQLVGGVVGSQFERGRCLVKNGDANGHNVLLTIWKHFFLAIEELK